jgi:hypothetical protein
MTEKGIFEKFTVTTGGEEEGYILEQKDLFFSELLAGYNIDRLEVFAEISSRYLAFEGFDQYDDRIRRSDDVLHTLTLFDEVIGLVYDRRSMSNFHSVSFHISELSEFGQKKLADLRQIADDPSSLE